MERTAVFVDAGYLFARGCEIIGHAETRRQFISLNLPEFNTILAGFLQKMDAAPLLRIYWYDGLAASGNMSSDQTTIALADNFKLRLGQINGFGKQKGVDSMIVTDMIELARNKAISDAILLGGDDDLRVGVQVSQTFGVRVHVLGFGSDAMHANVNRYLRQEADTSTTWEEATVRRFLSIATMTAPTPSLGVEPATVMHASPVDDVINKAVDGMVASLTSAEQVSIGQHHDLHGKSGIPSDIDRNLLRVVSTALGRPLDLDEKRSMRRRFNEKLKMPRP
ncbi:hypothetical protein N825_06630 [Skermanella stibiiresistens SB22]|uniref:NYN domain-containing protein n=1 Tax=Skermanella stibiiresistens SB22 TaxID=1385369 RepID=W9GZL4_9PROT|nr:NYN domain-containing protein [Skermanella stibiiresistens]EWY39370.1 hypothetical protein N825_06630 [Skermanella stibiiresistens SB22]